MPDMTIDTSRERERLAALEGHTEGPWGASYGLVEPRQIAGSIDNADHDICQCFGPGAVPNAVLIAAAPDLRDTVATLDALDAQAAEIERLRGALRIIAGYEQCLDNLMGNADIARAALSEREP